ncbi:pilus assembly protein CpaB [Terrabacter sp. 28]|nr:pilus assembly protein CpaB [Terrabacter sp. 28]
MNRRILAILLAVMLAVGGGFMVITYARNADARALAAESPARVYVAQKAIPAGTTLKDAERQEMIVETVVAAKALPAGALEEINADNNNLLALSDVQPGEFLLAARFGSTPVGDKAIEVPSGMIAVSVSLSDPARVGRFVTPGSKIAIYQSYQIKDLRDTPEAKILNENDVHGTSLLLPDVLVIGMGDAPLSAPVKATAEGEQPSAQAQQQAGGFLVTVAVSPADAPILIHGINNRTLYAGLRGSDVKIDPKLEVTDLQLREAVTTP